MASNEEYRSPPSGDPVIAPPDDDDDDTGTAVAMDGLGGGNAVAEIRFQIQNPDSDCRKIGL